MKTLTDIKSDMSLLYDKVVKGDCELKTAGELANIAGKYLKATQLELARDIWLDSRKPELLPPSPSVAPDPHEKE